MNKQDSEPAIEDRWNILSGAVQRKKLVDSFTLVRKYGFDPILIKGWSVARFYPESNTRISTDIDLVVAPNDFVAFERLVHSAEAKGLGIDPHGGFKNMETLPWSVLFGRSKTVHLDDTQIRVLADEDSLRLTAIHWLIDGGVNKSKLFDIYFLVTNRKDDFDWERCLDASGPTRRKWVIAVISAARDYLGLDAAGLPEEVKTAILPEWFVKTLEREWRLGPYRRVFLSQTIGKPKQLLEQIRRRFPPNPIAATVDVEGEMDERSRIPYQLRSLSGKVRPMISGLYRRYLKGRS